MLESILSSISPPRSKSSAKKKRSRRKKKKIEGKEIEVKGIVNEEEEDEEDADDVNEDEDMLLKSFIKNMKMGGKNETYSSPMTRRNKNCETFLLNNCLVDLQLPVVVESQLTGEDPQSPIPSIPSVDLPQLTPQEFCSACFESFESVWQELCNSNSRSSLTSSRAYKYRGFVNTGNTCYINCILQAILSIELFFRFLLKFQEKCHFISQLPALPFWTEVMSLMLTAFDSSGAIAPPDFLTSVVCEYRKKYDITPATSSSKASMLSPPQMTKMTGVRNEQADAMEFFTFLLDILHEEMRAIDCPLQKFNMQSTTSLDCGEWEEVGKGKSKIQVDEKQSRKVADDVIRSSVISLIFHGSIRSTVVYDRTNNCSVTYQRFHCLQVDIPKVASKDMSVKLIDAVMNCFEEEVISSDRHSRITKSITLEQAPRVLVLHLKRFQYDQKLHNSIKIQSEVSFPFELVIPSMCLSPNLLTKLEAVGRNNDSSSSISTTTSGAICSSVDAGENTMKSKSRKARQRRKAAKIASVKKTSEDICDSAFAASHSTIRPVNWNNIGLRYQLRAAVLHHGSSVHCGHYTSIVYQSETQSEPARWVHIDDLKVTVVSEEFVFSSVQAQVYMLFYSIAEDMSTII